MTTLNLLDGDFIGAETGRSLSFFNWVIRVHAGFRHGRAGHVPHTRRVHLPDFDRVRARRKPEYDPQELADFSDKIMRSNKGK